MTGRGSTDICDRRLSETEVKGILDRLPGLRLGVVGDFCLDVYLVIDPDAGEVSVETGLLTQPVAEQRCSLGGAGNVAANLRALGAGSVEAFGVTGADPYGHEMRRIMRRWGMGDNGLRVQQKGWDTHTYTKIYAQGREQPRIDFGNFNDLDPATAQELLGALQKALPRLDVLHHQSAGGAGDPHRGFPPGARCSDRPASWNDLPPGQPEPQRRVWRCAPQDERPRGGAHSRQETSK